MISGNTTGIEMNNGWYASGEGIQIKYNQMLNNDKSVVIKGNGSYQPRNLQFENNLIVGTTSDPLVDISAGSGHTFSNNNFISSSGLIIKNQTAEAVTAENNWWGVTTASGISDLVEDYYDDFELGKVDYGTALSSLNISAPVNNPVGLVGQTGPTTMQLSWTANSESDIAGYKVYFDTDGSAYPYANSVSTGSTSASYTLTGLTTGTIYYVAVAAIDSDGNESWISAEVRRNSCFNANRFDVECSTFKCKRR